MRKIKVVKQHDIRDCGVCSLASIIAYYGGYVPIEKLRLDTHTNELGTSALNLINASKKYGFDSMGVKVDSLYNDSVKLPAIAHITNKNGVNHFVVVYKITNKNVQIMDPAKGKIIMTIEEFNKVWNNILLLFYPKQKIIFMKKQNSLLQIFFKLLLIEKKLFLTILFSSVLLTIFTVMSSYYFKFAIESINNNRDFSYLKIIIFIFGILLFFKLVFNSIRKRLENHLNKNIDVLLLSNFLNHIFNLPLEVIESRSSGEVITRINELTNIKSLFTDIIISCALDLLLMLTSMPILYKINDQLFLILLFLIIIYLLVGIITSKIIYKLAYRNIDFETEFNSSIIENLNLMNSIKNLKLTSNVLRKIEKVLSTFLFDSFKLTNFIYSEENLKLFINEFGLFFINTIGFYLIYKNELSITELITFNTLVVYFLDPIKNIINSIPKYNFLKASFTKINEFLSVNEERMGEENTILNNNIEVQNLNYSYNGYNQVLNNLNFSIASGDFIMLKGSSGCGKSTFCNILERHINDYEGNIIIGDVNIKDYSISTIRNSITFISQNETLFTGTIKENIIFDRDIDLKEFNEICSLCYVDEIVDKKPLRYETIINNESKFISGGERQRIILARALLKKSSIYLLDEALSEVDYEMERNIINNLKNYFKGKTIIYITHKTQDDLFDNIIKLEESHGL